MGALVAFPQEHYQPFVDLVSTLIPYALAIMMADLVRRRAIKKGTWFRRGADDIGANYVRIALVCGFTGYVGLVLWGFAQVETMTAVGLQSRCTLCVACDGDRRLLCLSPR